MLMRVLLLVVAAAQVFSTPLPEKSPALEFGGFQPVHGSRATGPAAGYGAPPLSSGYSAPPLSSGYGAPGPFGGDVGVGPVKTIYVNVPHPEPVKSLPPIAAGPPRKHYKIVFIRAPPPQPPPQPILPPRTEQKTLIYVLHQRPQVHEQKIINLPQVQHDPEVYFVQYDNPPSAEELQQLSAGNLEGYSVAAQRTGPTGDAVGPLSLVADGAGSPEIDARLGLGGAGSGLSQSVNGAGVSLKDLGGAGLKSSLVSSLSGVGASATGVALPGLGGVGHGSGAGIGSLGIGGGLSQLGESLGSHLGSSGVFRSTDDVLFRPIVGLSSERDLDNSFENRVGVSAGEAVEVTPLAART
ncbi:uncharacterized protein [Procambarus clarkii]|uniref:uncharacterized protein n=1 Tax=Procambarus clarkii TaxID=6728 RepID=UPI001E677FDF|nr:uncharacterized protein LOC123760222 [Procambarus clarkii]